MKIAVRYFSKSKNENTRKLAKAMSEALGVEALDISHPVDKDTDILFLGNSVYYEDVDPNVKSFIDNLELEKGTIYNFSSSAIRKSTHSQIKKCIEERKRKGETGLKLSDKEFFCKGEFGLMHKDRPNSCDLMSIKDFAKNVVAAYN
ncbi:NADPH-dependent FMN reductase family protein [Lachnospira multipara]|uniref:hypothetical protein n=1 Tax=Lachnospira multipara TaxID=28051 RepID=UPI00040FA82B|nr:hypothetical protein [Lachnospira multipara]